MIRGRSARIPALAGAVSALAAWGCTPVEGAPPGPCTGRCGDGACDRDRGEESDCPVDCSPLPGEPFGAALAAAFDAGTAGARSRDPETLPDRVRDVYAYADLAEARAGTEVSVHVAARSVEAGYEDLDLVLTGPLLGSFRLRLLRPEGAGPGSAPAAIGVHGHGSLSDGMRDEYGARDLARGGAVVALPEFPSLVDDLHAEARPAEDLLGAGRTLMGLRLLGMLEVVDLVRALPEVDRARIGAFGHSAGAILSVLAAAGDARVKAVVTDWDPAAVTTRDNLIGSSGSWDNYVPGLSALGDWADLVGAVAASRPLLVQDYDYPQGPGALVAFLGDALAGPPVAFDGACGPGEAPESDAAECAADAEGESEATFRVHLGEDAPHLDPDAEAVAAWLLAAAARGATTRDPSRDLPFPLRTGSARVLDAGTPAGLDFGCRPGPPVHGSPSRWLAARDPRGADVRARMVEPPRARRDLAVVLAPPFRGGTPGGTTPGTPAVLVGALTDRGFRVIEPLLPGADPAEAWGDLLPLRLLLVGTSLPAVWAAELSAVLDALGEGEGGGPRAAVVAWGGWAGPATCWTLAEPRVAALAVDRAYDPALSQPGWDPVLRLPGGATAGDAGAWERAAGDRLAVFEAGPGGAPADPGRLAQDLAARLGW